MFSCKIIMLLTVLFADNLYAKVYKLTNDPIDVVIMCHKKDQNKINLCIIGIKKYGKNVNRIIVVSETKLTNNAEWFQENKFPFNRKKIVDIIFPNDVNAQNKFFNYSRSGWITKQIFNLYAPFVIPGISSNVLALDADTIFINPVEFIDSNGNALYNPGTEYHIPYFIHAKKLIKGPNQINKVFKQYSGISHHMLFQKPILQDLFKQIKETHKMEPWKAICKCLEKNQVYKESMAEYEIYFNFAFAQTNQVKIRKLKWKNVSFTLENIQKYQRDGFNYVSCHHYLTKKIQ